MPVLLLTMFSGSVAYAEVKYYQYDGKLPFVEMMLTMMEAMGVVDRIPARGQYGVGAYGLNNRAALYRHPYLRALAMRGYPVEELLRRNGYNSHAFSDAYGAQGYNGGYDTWSSSDWGVLPLDHDDMLDVPSDSPWKSDELEAWKKEAWKKSLENEVLKNELLKKQLSEKSEPQSQSSSTQDKPPVVLNNIITTHPSTDADTQNGIMAGASADRGKHSPLSKLELSKSGAEQSPHDYLAPPSNNPSASGMDDAVRAPSQQQLQASPLYKYSEKARKYVMANPEEAQDFKRRQKEHQKEIQKQKKMLAAEASDSLCVTDDCGLKKPDLDGLWIAQNGEMLGIKENRYLWSDGVSRYLNGQLKVLNEYLIANVEGYDRTMQFKYKLANNHLLTMQPDGSIREFVRMPTNRPPESMMNQFNQVPY